MTLIIGIFSIVIFLIILEFLDSPNTLLLYGIFMAYVSMNFETYFVTGLTEAEWTPFVVICGLITSLAFIKMVWRINKRRESLTEA